jgi:hypothetical protein
MTGFIPVSGATNVTSGETMFIITAEFSQPLDPARVNISSFLLRLSGSSTNLSGVAFRDSIDTTRAMFVPSSGVLKAQTPSTGASYTPIILGSGNAVGLRNLEGFFAATVSGSFVTAGIHQPVDTVAPVVSGNTPASGSTSYPVSGRPTVKFSEAVVSGTISGQIKVRVSGVGSDVPATIALTADRYTVTITPTAYLSGNTVYRGHVNTGVTDVAGNALAASYVWSFTTFNPTPPSVTDTDPDDLSTGFAVSGHPIVYFNTDLQSGTISTGSIKVRVSGSSTDVSGVVTLSSNLTTVEFTPNVMLSHCTLYRGFVHNSVKEVFGINTMAASFGWSFTTYCPPAPTVSTTTPANGALDTAIDVDPVIVFSTLIRSGTVSGQIKIRISGQSTDIPATVSVSSNLTTVKISPTADLSHCKLYVGFIHNTIKEQLGVSNMAASYSWSFNTICPGAPVVTATVPVCGATNVNIAVKPTVTFNKQLASSTVSTNSFHLRISGSSVDIPSTVTLSSNLLSVQITPSNPIGYAAVFNAFINNSVTEVLGVIPMVASYTWNFTTQEPSMTAIYNVTTAGGGTYSYVNDSSRAGLKIEPNSSLVNHKVKKATIYLKGNLSSGVVSVRVRGSGDGIATTLGTIPVANITDTLKAFSVTNLSSNYAFRTYDRLMVEYLPDDPFGNDLSIGLNISDPVPNVIVQIFAHEQIPPYPGSYTSLSPEMDLAATLYELSA